MNSANGGTIQVKFTGEDEDLKKKTLDLSDLIKGNLISEAIKGGFEALASSISSVGQAFTNSISGAASYGDNMLTMSAQTGISTQNLQKYNAISELVDVSTETMTSSMARNIRSMNSGSKAYAALGVSVKDANGNLRDSDAVYWETIDALGKVQDDTTRDAMAMEIFGRSAQELNPLIQQGSAGINKLGQEAESTGAILSDKAVKALGAMDDQFQIFKTSTGATKNIFAGLFASMITDVTGGANKVIGLFNGLMNAIANGQDTTQILANINTAITQVVNQLVADMPQIIQTVSTLIANIGLILAQNLPVIINSLIQILPQLIQVVIQAASTIVSAILGVLPQLLQAAITILIAIMNGLAQEAPTLIPEVVDALLQMIPVLIDNLPLFLQAGWQLIIGLAQGILNASPKILNEMFALGPQLLRGLWNGIQSMAGWLWNKVSQWAQGLINGVKNFFGIHSPSTEFAFIGEMNAKGLIKGLDDMQGEVQDSFNGMFDLSPNMYGMANNQFNPSTTVVVNNNYKQDPLGRMVNDIKTYSGGSKNDYNYGTGV